ncbi:MAG: glycosyltransferase family 39 protein [Acidobacteria bacterium]|nr:glycosyltransferase family 39 protein [Acidobacteriota bacterium]
MLLSTRVHLAAIVCAFLALAGALSYTKRPWADEAWFANISWNILHNGKTGISVLDPRGDANMLGKELPGINREFYIWIPAQEAVNALWYKIAGLHVLTMRAASMLWGLAVLAAWFAIVRKLTNSASTAALAILLISTDFAFLDASSDGRMDIMCAGLSYNAIAAYLLLREQRLCLAIAVSQALGVAAGLTHPMGAVGFTTVLFLIFYLDRKRIGRRHVATAMGVYLAGIAVAAAYILPGLSLFRAQFGVALAGRVGVTESAGNTFVREFTLKYRDYYLPSYASGVSYLRVLIPAIYLIGVVGAICSRSVRNHAGQRTLLWMTIAAIGSIAVLDSGKLYYYLVHSTPYLAMALSLWVAASWARGGVQRVVACASAVVLIALHAGWIANTVRKDPYHKSFLPMAEFVRQQIHANRDKPFLVMSSAELGFAISFDGPLSDDALLGYGSGRRADVVIMEARSYESHYQGFQRYRPEVAAHIRRLLEQELRLAYNDGYYKVYAR